MEDKKHKPKIVAIVGAGESGIAITKAITEKANGWIVVAYDKQKAFENPTIPIVNFKVSEIQPTFIEKPRKKRRQDLFKK